MLSRLGIGHLTLVDGDVFDESNLNRQLLSSPRLLGCKKAEVAAARVAEINAAVTTRVIAHFLAPENGADILRDVDLAIDCLDNIPSRFVLETACRQAAIPLVSAAIAGWSGQATVIFPGDAGLRLLYGPADKAPRKGIAAATILLGRTSPLRHSLLLSDLSDHNSDVVALDDPPQSP
jgi:molybdopterin/thiamine biosynthesis adenylyltransferase